MKVTAVPTSTITTIEGVQARVWKATTEDGVEFMMFVVRCAVPEDADQQQFQVHLKSMPEPQQAPLSRVLSARLN